MFWMNLAGDEFVVGQMVLNCWKNISSAYISCTNTGQIRSFSWQKRGMRLLTRNLGSLYIQAQRINKTRRKFPEAPGQWWPRVPLPLAIVWGRPNLWSPGFLSAPSTNSKSQKKQWKRMKFLYNRVSAQRMVVVPKLFLVGWEGLVTLDKHGEQNCRNKRPRWIVFKREKS